MQLPSEYFEKLKCRICTRFLSLFPIYSTKNDDNQLLSVCGRCELPDDNKKYLRNEIYETVVQALLFPCINKDHGCSEELLPEDVKQHELICPFQPKKCIYSERNNCKWEGPFIILLGHCKTEHNDLFLENNEFDIKMNENHNILNVLQYQNEMFLFERCYDSMSKRLKCSLVRLGFDKITKMFYGQIQLKSETCSLTLDLPTILFYGNKAECLDRNIQVMSDVDNTNIVGKVDISVNKKQFNQITTPKQMLEQFISCSKCRNVLSIPSFRCFYSHYACNNCKHKYCEICYSLGKSTELNIPVKPLIKNSYNIDYDQCLYCYEIVENPIDHENKCFSKNHTCFICECSWQNRLQNLEQHLFNEHRDKIIKVNEIIQFDMVKNPVRFSGNIRDSKFFKFSSNLFKLIIQYKEDYILWSVEIIDSVQKNNNFKYEVTLSNNKGQQTIIRQYCGELSSTNEYKIGDQYCISTYDDQIQDYLVSNCLLYKINIIK